MVFGIQIDEGNKACVKPYIDNKIALRKCYCVCGDIDDAYQIAEHLNEDVLGEPLVYRDNIIKAQFYSENGCGHKDYK